MAGKIKNILPKIVRFSERSSINKKISKKSIKAIVNEPSETNLLIDFIIGKSEKREEILRLVEEELNLNIYEF